MLHSAKVSFAVKIVDSLKLPHYSDSDGMATDGSTVVTKQLDHTPTGDEKWEHEATSVGEEEQAGEEAKGNKKEEEEEEDLSLTALLGEIGTAASDATKWGFIGFSNVRSAVKTTVSCVWLQ